MKNILLLFSLILLNSCIGRDGFYVDLKNNTDKPIKNVIIKTKNTTWLQFEEVKPNENITKRLDLSEMHKKDITYSISYELYNGKSVVSSFDVNQNQGLEYRQLYYKIKGEYVDTAVTNSGP